MLSKKIKKKKRSETKKKLKRRNSIENKSNINSLKKYTNWVQLYKKQSGISNAVRSINNSETPSTPPE
jgi:hypothetical protein